MPFADSARKWHVKYKSGTKGDSQKSPSDDEAKAQEVSSEPRMSLRRSKRTSNILERDNDDDTDALSELETLAKLGRVDETLTPEDWFSERALETRLHHIAHAVQNCEWPSTSVASSSKTNDSVQSTENLDDRKQTQKRHIAIDVETERAKLHALLSSPQAAHSSSRDSHRPPTVLNPERDDASSDSGSRRSTPAPPPAHQRVVPSPAPSIPPSPSPISSNAAAPVDLSTPLDLSEAQDFSMGRRTPQADASPSSAPPARSRLDDTLTRLMKRKNVPAPEQIVSKEKKRKKLDEIVLGLSAAKGRSPSSISSYDSPRSKGSSVLPEVTVTPAAPPSSSTSTPPAQKPFSVTVTNVPSPHSSSKELSSFLQQSMEQTIKSQKASTSTSTSTNPKPYSHEAKVNKWLAEQANVDTRRRALTPRLAPDEHVPVVHRATGKRLVGHKAPQLKHLAQWIAENPMYDIDSKWTEGIKEHVKLPQDVRNPRSSQMQQTSSVPERKKGRPPTLDSTSTNILSSNAHVNQNLSSLNPALLASLSSLSAFDPKTLAATLTNLTGFDPKLLSSLSSFDPKNNPLLNTFSSMPNLLGNITGGNIFANLAGLGLPGFPSLDMNSLSGSSGSSDNKGKTRKSSEPASSASKSSNSQFPFVFPSPNMLYPQLGLSGLSPFGVHSGMSSAYDALGILSGNVAASSTASSLHSSTSHTHSSRSSTKTTAPRSSTVVTNSATSRQQKVSDRTQSSHLPQILLPPDPYLLESLSKQTLNYDAAFKADKRSRETDGHDTIATDLSKTDKKKNPFDPLRSHMPPEFAAVQEKLLKGDKKDIDISKMLLEQMASGALSASLVSSAEAKKNKELEKDIYEKLGKPPEYLTRVPEDNTSAANKRTLDEISNEPENLAVQSVAKKVKESSLDLMKNIDKQSDSTNTGEMDLEDLIAPSTVIKTGMKASDFEIRPTESSLIIGHSERDEKCQQSPHRDRELQIDDKFDYPKNENEKDDISIDDMNPGDASSEMSRRGNKKKGRKSSEDSSFGLRRELRSSSVRQSTESTTANH